MGIKDNGKWHDDKPLERIITRELFDGYISGKNGWITISFNNIIINPTHYIITRTGWSFDPINELVILWIIWWNTLWYHINT